MNRIVEILKHYVKIYKKYKLLFLLKFGYFLKTNNILFLFFNSRYIFLDLEI